MLRRYRVFIGDVAFVINTAHTLRVHDCDIRSEDNKFELNIWAEKFQLWDETDTMDETGRYTGSMPVRIMPQ